MKHQVLHLTLFRTCLAVLLVPMSAAIRFMAFSFRDWLIMAAFSDQLLMRASTSSADQGTVSSCRVAPGSVTVSQILRNVVKSN